MIIFLYTYCLLKRLIERFLITFCDEFECDFTSEYKLPEL